MRPLWDCTVHVCFLNIVWSLARVLMIQLLLLRMGGKQFKISVGS